MAAKPPRTAADVPRVGTSSALRRHGSFSRRETENTHDTLTALKQYAAGPDRHGR
ncbi:hypothetical protein GCM10010365_21910 [Streptomyces poonensis]|uniref:Uncharacterized protein n=1 Tax=Streptomyces poonensis TaxID=68255 RepID=A0A918PFM1_9ACTN|nr:hypothetical protein GCM10010365_21910 [Streptomyces poonensis]GLJ93797.1 hypothetical protein GCM10017589_64140 [Streptomyces poonensis]